MIGMLLAFAVPFFYYAYKHRLFSTTGYSPRRLLSTRKDAAAAAALGLLPQERQNPDLPAPDPETEAALREIRAGAGRSWEAAARLLRTAGSRWTRRSDCATALGHLAATEGDRWLRDWLDARPDDADAALVYAESRILHAWELRGPLLAERTSQQQFANFHRALEEARAACARAVALAPADDPCPYAAEISVAIGVGYSHEDFRALWAEITARDPHHIPAHFGALQYWCAKWRGSENLARAFAQQAADRSAPGTMLSALVLIAAFEHLDRSDRADEFRTPEMIAATESVLADAAHAARHELSHSLPPAFPEARHMLGYFLFQQRRYAEAVEQFTLVDGGAGSVPWAYHEDPVKAYLTVRDAAVAKARR